MQQIHFSDIAKILKTTPVQQHSDPAIEYLLTDSRKLLFAKQTVFFTINSQQRNAHQYIEDLYEQGVRCFITDKNFAVSELKKYEKANFIIVDNVVEALQTIAAAHRKQFNYPVIAITGSNGKTIVKEWLFQLLSNEFTIVRSPKSYNSQIGVPLSVWQMATTDTLAIFEAGISRLGEMEKLQHIIEPGIGILTFAGDAHAEGFSDLDQKINEKLKLFSQSKILFYCGDDINLSKQIDIFKTTNNRDLHLFKWGKSNSNLLMVENIEKRESSSSIQCSYKNNSFSFIIPFIDDASVNNAITCCCVVLYFNIKPEEIAEKMPLLKPIEMRLELKQGMNNTSIINDSYNADINSLAIALDFLQQQKQHDKHTVILSDVLQSGFTDELLYQNIAEVLKQKSLYRFIGIGPQISKYKKAFEKIRSAVFFSSTEEFMQQLPAMQFGEETILLKGARPFTFEKISKALEQKMHQTFLEVNLNALRHNLKQYQQQLKPGVKIMAMVKAFSYGSGSFEIASLLQHAGVDYLGVAYVDEGVELRKAGIRIPIMVMNTEAAGFDNIVKYGLEPELYSFNILNSFKNFLANNNIESFKIHIKLDTGMHRLGFEESDIDDLIALLKGAKRLQIQSVFSHLAASDERMHDTFTALQAERFLKMSTTIENAIGYTFIKHLGNTAAIHRHRQLQFNMVRLGIGLYGVDSNPAMQQQLLNVGTLKTTISQIKKIKKGESVGYSRKGIAEKDSVIATVRLGYADGYSRAFSNGKGKMLVNGKPAPVIGNVSMDMTMIDITGIDAKEEDEVIVFGETLPVSDLAKWINTIPYEILTGISQRVKRIYFEE